MIWSALAGGQLFTDNSAHTQRIHQAFTRAGQIMGLSTTGSGRIHAVTDALAASQIQMDAVMWFKLLEVIRGYEVA